MENIIQFLIAESRCYLRAKNSHNLTLKKIQDSPPPQPAAKREAWARRRSTAYAMASTGSCAARGFEWTTQWRRHRGDLSTSTARCGVQQLRCIPILQGVWVEAAMRGSGTEPLLPLQHAAGPPQLRRLPVQQRSAGGARRWREAGRAPFYLDSKANYGSSASARCVGPFYLLCLLRELGCGTMAGEEGRSEMVGERRGLQLTSNP